MRLGPAAAIRYLTLGKIGDWFRGIKNDPRNPQRHTSLILDRENIDLWPLSDRIKTRFLNFSKTLFYDEKLIPGYGKWVPGPAQTLPDPGKHRKPQENANKIKDES